MKRHRTWTVDAMIPGGAQVIILAVLATADIGCAGADSAAATPSPAPAPCSEATAATPPSILDGTVGDEGEVPELSTADLKAALADPAVIVLDARPFDEFAVSHIPGARSVPGKPGLPPSLYTADVEAMARTIPDRSQQLVLYCNGLFCGRSKRFGAELRKNGYTRVRRYQLGTPGWRALGGVTQVEKEALVSLLQRDATAVLIDARERATAPRLANARSVPLQEASKAKDDGRLPMMDHNTRIFVVGDDGAQARAVGEAIVRDAFHNVSFYAGSVADLPELVERPAR
jgi:rhodanese-related sulfurtransferase